MKNTEQLLRIRIALNADAHRCEWALLTSQDMLSSGECALADLPSHDGRAELLLLASDVLIAELPLPDNARHQSESLLAYAVEDIAAGDPQSNLVSWLGVDDTGVHTLAVLDKSALERWRSALSDLNIHTFDLRCEALQLPRAQNTWSVAWDGTDGFVRSTDVHGWATDRGNHNVPPLSLSLALSSLADSALPASIQLYCAEKGTKPDFLAWSALLGVPVIDAGDWDWRLPVGNPGPLLSQQRRPWELFSGLLPRLRPAMWLILIAAFIQSAALAIDHTMLNAEQHALRAQMEKRFRSVFPEAVAVINPALQMQRQLTQLRQVNGIGDHHDFLPMLQQVAHATQQLRAGMLRTVSWENGRMTVLFVGIAEHEGRLLQSQLQQGGLRVEISPGESAWEFIVSPA